MKTLIRFSYLTVLLCLFSLTACNDDESNPDQTSLDINRAKWNAAAITSYVYHYDITCFCVPRETVVVTVTDGQVSDAFFTPSGVALTPVESASLIPLDGFFDRVQAAIDMNAYELQVTFHPTHGFPTYIYVDQLLGLADDEVGYTISEFQ